MISFSSIMQNIVSGLNMSAILLVAALGLVIIFGLMGVINMAHGELIMIGAYVTFFVTSVLHLPFVFAIIFSYLVTSFLGALIEIFIVKSLYSKPTETLLATFAISLILERAIYFIFGPETKNVSMPIEGYFKIGTVTVPYYNLFVICFSILILLVMNLSSKPHTQVCG